MREWDYKNLTYQNMPQEFEHVKVIIVASGPWPGGRLLLDYEFSDFEENLIS